MGSLILKQDTLPMTRQSMMRLGILLSLLGLAASLWVVIRRPTFLPIASVRIEGAFHHLSRSGIEQAIIPHTQRNSFFSLNLRTLHEELLRLPWVAQVRVSRQWPNGLVIYLEEQKAVARWGDAALLNSQGIIFSPKKDSFPGGLPVLKGPEGQQKFMLEQFRHIGQMLAPFSLSVSEFVISERRAWQLRLSNGTTLLLGRVKPIQHLKRFLAAYDQVFRVADAHAESVDLRYETGMAVRWASSSPNRDHLDV